MYIAILGRQPALGIAELERRYQTVSWFSIESALFDGDRFSIESVGGSQKAGRVIATVPYADWKKVSFKLVSLYSKKWSEFEGKLTLGISAYGFAVAAHEVQKTGLILKSKLKNSGVSIRLVPNQEAFLNSASSHHNKLGLSENKVELLVVKGSNGSAIIAESVGAQNITALAARDQGRPKRDAFVGMLPPKLAQIMINMAGVQSQNALSSSSNSSSTLARVASGGATPPEPNEASEGGVARLAGPESSDLRGTSKGSSNDGSDHIKLRLLDPFCGTGVLLQEAALLGYDVYGTDLSEKMIRYSRDNLKWLAETHHVSFDVTLQESDATSASWKPPIDLVVSEVYLGQPFSAPPSKEKLKEVRGNCNHIISQFLKNIAPQLQSGTPLCLAVPAWRDSDGSITHLPLIAKLENLGYQQINLSSVSNNQLLYFREDQVVARQLLILVRS